MGIDEVVSLVYLIFGEDDAGSETRARVMSLQPVVSQFPNERS